eukprot:m.14719 g.14719  ORF g.14719 m.14719 type:complete len:416 (+) comp25921_c0_seq1:1232-2479(+)
MNMHVLSAATPHNTPFRLQRTLSLERATMAFCCSCWSSAKEDDENAQQLISEASFDTGDYKPPETKLIIPKIQDFHLIKTVGKGSFGKVFQVQNIKSKAVLALKAVHKASVKTKREEARVLAEAQILRRIDHPFCVSLKATFQTAEHLFYAFQFLGGGMLFFHLRKQKCFSEVMARFYIQEIILAIEYLHSLGIIFRDLKPENVLLHDDGHICLTDFGSAKDLEGSQETSTFCGTPQYIAPEIIRGEQYGLTVDWWSCGIFLYEMLAGKAPFQARDRLQLYKKVLRGSVIFPPTFSTNAVNLITQLLQKKSTLRIGSAYTNRSDTAAEIKKHAFFFPPEGKSEFENWAWEDLEARAITPPFVPEIKSDYDVSNFDWSLTSEACVLPHHHSAGNNDEGAVKSLYNRKLADFDFVAA